MSAFEDLQAYLTAQGIVDGSTDWPSVLGVPHDGLPQSPVGRLVVFTPDGGLQPEIPAPPLTMGGAAWEYPQVQVRVRGNPDEGPVPVLEKHAEIQDAMHGLLSATVGERDYAGVFALSGVLSLGPDDRNRHEATVSYQMVRPVRIPASL